MPNLGLGIEVSYEERNQLAPVSIDFKTEFTLQDYEDFAAINNAFRQGPIEADKMTQMRQWKTRLEMLMGRKIFKHCLKKIFFLGAWTWNDYLDWAEDLCEIYPIIFDENAKTFFKRQFWLHANRDVWTCHKSEDLPY